MRRKNDVFAETVVGVFMAAVLALLAYFTIVISGVDILVGRAKVPVSIEFSDVGGLKNRDSVMYRGMKVGVIEEIDLSRTNVMMSARINADVVLREGYRISVASYSLLGGNYLLLEEGAGEPLPLETTVFRGEPPTDWMRAYPEELCVYSHGPIGDVEAIRALVGTADQDMAGFNDGLDNKHKLYIMNPSPCSRQALDDTGFSDTFLFIHSVTEVQ